MRSSVKHGTRISPECLYDGMLANAVPYNPADKGEAQIPRQYPGEHAKIRPILPGGA